MGAPFVGRADELRQLRDLLASRRRETGPVAALITGEPGSGKSRLLREALATADPRRTVSLVGFEPTQTMALAAAGELVRRLASVPRHGPRLQDLVFGSNDLVGQGALPAFETAYQAVVAFGPINIAIDDLQWVDAQSVALIQYLVRAAESSRTPLAVVAASRPSPQTAVFLRGIEGSIPESRVVRQDLAGLSRADGAALAQALDATLDTGRAEELWRRAAGSPFWIETLAHGPSQSTIADLIAARLRNLSGDAASLLALLAVGARPFDRREVAALVGWPAKRAEHGLTELVSSGVVLDDRGTVRLTHDLIREAVTSGIPVATRRELHRQLGEHVESRAGDDPKLLAEVLEHRASAGRSTAELAIRIVESPQRRLLGRDDLVRLSAAADAMVRPDAAGPRLDAGIGKLASELAEPELAIRHWSRAAAMTQDDRTRQQGHLEAARAAYVLRRADETRAHLRSASAAAVDAVGEIALCALAADVGLWLEPDTSGSGEQARRALELATMVVAAAGGVEHLGREAHEAVLAAHESAADAAMREERRDDSLQLTERALAIAEALDDEARLDSLLKGAVRYRTFGSVDIAERHYREAWETAHRLALPLQVVTAGQGLVRVFRSMARIREATAVAEEASEVEHRIGVVWKHYGTMSMLRHALELQRGEPGAVTRLAKDAEGLDPHAAIGIHLAVGYWIARLSVGDVAKDVERELAAARTAAAIARCPRCGRDAAIQGAELLARIGRVDEARQELAAWEASLAEQPNAIRELEGRRTRAVIEAGEGHRAAVALFRGLAADYAAASHIEEAIFAWLDLGALHRRLGDRAEAIDAYSQAAALAEPGGATALGRLAGKALRELGVRTWRRGRTSAVEGVAALSDREREIAGLVAEGATNRDIATTLALSPKTVERHVTNILAKLGARNRTELASLLHAAAGTGFPR
jgi:DNA-binding CsgD family transcriptional regulator